MKIHPHIVPASPVRAARLFTPLPKLPGATSPAKGPKKKRG